MSFYTRVLQKLWNVIIIHFYPPFIISSYFELKNNRKSLKSTQTFVKYFKANHTKKAGNFIHEADDSDYINSMEKNGDSN